MASTDKTPRDITWNPRRLQKTLSSNFPSPSTPVRVWGREQLIRAQTANAQPEFFKTRKDGKPLRVVIGGNVVQVTPEAIARHFRELEAMREDFGLPKGFDFSSWSYTLVEGPEIPSSEEGFAETYEEYPILPGGSLYYSEGTPGGLLDSAYIVVYALISTMNFMGFALGEVEDPDTTNGDGLLITVQHSSLANAVIEVYDAGYAEYTQYGPLTLTLDSLSEL